MKNIIKAFTGIALSLLMVSACNVENIKETYTPQTNSEVSFAQANINATAILAAQTVFEVPVVRSTPGAAVTVSIKATLPDGLTCPSSVSFAAGESKTVLPIDISAMAIGSQYKGSIEILDNFNEKVNVVKTNLTLAKAYTWVSLGQGEWFDNLALMSSDSYGIQKVEVLKAEGFDRYRIVGPYADNAQLAKAWSEDNLGGAKSAYIEIWSVNGTNLVWDKWWNCGLIYEGEGTDIKAYLPSALNSTQAPNDAKSKKLSDKFFTLYPYWYIDGVGGFGLYLCALSLPGGPDMETWLNEN
ncbi:MAG: hypothetical protein PHD11_03610 [Bacteroidales bacterium]|nr:hypothetical protein [Bacteroidales bacterium]MDD4670304.1 hypothetical protein [Bacteroidales bacterium]